MRVLVVISFLFVAFNVRSQELESDNEFISALYKELEQVKFPKLPKLDIRSGTCFVKFNETGDWEILNSLGASYNDQINLVLVAWRAQDAVPPNFALFIPITFISAGFEYARVEKPDIVPAEVKVSGSASSKSSYKKDKISQTYHEEYRNGNYSKSLRYLDELVLLDPYKTSLRIDRIKIFQLLGDPALGCEDFTILKEILKYEGVSSNPCLN